MSSGITTSSNKQIENELDMAHFDLGSYIGGDFLHSMMMVTIKQVYGYVVWFALALAAVFLLCDIPAVRTNIRKVPRWPVYAIEYLAKLPSLH